MQEKNVRDLGDTLCHRKSQLLGIEQSFYQQRKRLLFSQENDIFAKIRHKLQNKLTFSIDSSTTVLSKDLHCKFALKIV